MADIFAEARKKAKEADEEKRKQTLQNLKVNKTEKTNTSPVFKVDPISARTTTAPQKIPDAPKKDVSAGEFAMKAGLAGLDQVWKGAAQTIDFVLPDKFTPRAVQNVLDAYVKLGEDTAKDLEEMSDTKGKKFAGQLISGAAGTIPSAVLAYMSGGATLAAQGGTLAAEGGAALTTKAALQKAIKETAKNPTFALNVAQTLGPTYEKEREEGASELKAGASALTNALLGAAVETSGGIETFKKGTGVLKNALRSAGEEGLEEIEQYSIENLTNKALGSNTAKWFSTDENEAAVINPVAQAKAGATGAILGGIMGGGQAAVAKGVNKAAERIPDAKQPQAIPEAKSAEKNATYTMSQETQQKIFDAVQKRTGVTIQYADLPDGIDGSYENGVITVSNKAKNPGYTVLKHELTHFIEKSGDYQALSNFIETSLRETGYDVDAELDSIIKSYAEIGQNLSPEQAKKEFVAKFSEEYLFNSEKSIERLARENPNLFQRVYDWIVDTVTKIGASQETKFLIDAQRKYEKALRTAGKNTYAGPTLNSKQYLYAGSSALNADLDKRQLAEQMLQEGYSPETVWRDTGWKRDAESGDMKFEIDDSASKVMYERLKRRGTVKLKDVLKHQELYAAYPELENAKVIAGNYGENVAQASFNRLTNTAKVNLDKVKDSEVLRSVLLHEVQHRIQKIEGFETGGNPRDMVKELRQQTANRLMKQDRVYYSELKKKLGSKWQNFIDDEIKKEYSVSTIEEAGKIAYRNLLGEKEARSVQERMNMFPAQREMYLPTYEEEALRRNEKGKGNTYSLTGDNLLDDSGPDRQSGSVVDSALWNRGIEAGDKPAFSMQKNKDSDGNTLTPRQKEFFKESVVRDEQGNLLVLYHGSRSKAFTEFDLVEGAWLTPVQSYAETYAEKWHSWIDDYEDTRTTRDDINGIEPEVYSDPDYRIYKMYANIKAPLNLGEIDGPLSEGYVRSIAKRMGVRYSEVDEIAKDFYEEYTYMFTRSSEFIEFAKSHGYDGFIATESGKPTFCVFDAPNQVKLVSNQNPTASDDIRYSAGSGLQQSDNLKSASENMYAKDAEKMTELAAKAAGYDHKLYHQTGAAFTEFNTENQQAGKYDSELPTGIFMKPTEEDIGLRGKNQMGVYAKMKNPLTLRNREHARYYWMQNVPGYEDALVKLQQIDAHYKAEHEKATKQFRDFITEWRKNNPDAERNALYKVEEFNRLFEREDEVVDEWEAAANEARLEAKALIDKYISDSNFDGVILEEDQGSFGRKVKSYIALDPRQVKSSDPVTYDNNMNPIPLSERFNEEKTDIRYSAGSSLRENGSLKRASQNMYADTEGNKLTESQKKFFRNSKVRDNEGNLKVMYHGTGNAGFTVFNPSYSGDGQGLFFTDSPEVARGYSATEKIFSPVNFESPEELQEYILDEMGEDVEIRKNGDRYELWQDGEFVVRDRDLHSLYWSFNDEIVGYGGDSGNYKVYLNLENPLIVDAHNDNWDEITVDWSEEKTTTNDIAWYAMENGYDGVIINNVVDIGIYSPTRDMKPSTVAVAFNPNQIKAVNNENPSQDEDIRFSTGENLKREASLFRTSQTLYGEKGNKYLEYNTQSGAGEEPASFIAPEPVRGEKKATSYQRRARKNAREAVKNILGVSKFADTKKIDAALDSAIEKMKTHSFTMSDQDALFDEMFSEGIVVNQQMVKEYANLKQTIRNTRLHVTDDVARNITDFQTFRKDNLNNIRLSNDSGSEIDTFYDELQRDYPQLFPDLNTPAEMLEKISEVGKSIKETETRLQDMYDADFDEFYAASKESFNREIEKLQNESTRVSRYLKDRNKKISVADAKARIEEIGRLRREADKVKNKVLLTDIDKTYVEMLHNGKMNETMVRSLTPLSADAIMQVYTAEKPLKEAQAALKEVGNQTRAEYRQLASQALQGSEFWKDKKAGILYGRETAERNMLDIAGSSGRKLIKEFFSPVHKAEAASTRMKNDLRADVKDLNIFVKDTYDVTDLMLDAPGLSEKIAEAKSKGKRLKVSESTLLQLYGEGLISREDLAHVKADANKIESAATEMRNIYNQLIDAANRELIRHGYEPIEYRQDYFPHFSEDKPDGVLANIANKLGFNIVKDELPTDIAGLTHTFKPGKKWFGNALQRTSRVTEYDAIKGFDIYLEGVADVIYQTENIQKLRQLESELRYRYSTEGVKAEIDKINADTELSEVQKQAMLDQVYEKSNTHLGNLAVWLRGYTDSLAGKKAQIDRTFEHNIGRGLYNTSKAIENRVAANMVAVNPGSWLTNFIPLVQGSEVKNRNIIKGMAQTIGNHFNHDGITDASTFITNREGSDVLWKSTTEVWQDRMTKPMQIIDSFVSESLVRARYLEEVENGKSAYEAMEIADEFAAGVIADRSKGSLPTVFNAKNPISKILTMYQVEVNNQWSHLFKDIPRTEENVMKVAWAYAKFAIGAYIFNDVYEYIVGRRPALDPISWVNDFIGDLTGKQIPNFVEALFAAIKGEGLEPEEKEKKGAAASVTALGENAAEDIPFVGGLLGGGRVPIQSALPDAATLATSTADLIAGENQKKALSDIGKELLKPATYMVLPMGGGQLKKVGETALDLARGGNYAMDSEGEKKLRFAVDPTVGNALKGSLFGQYSLKSAQDYVKSDFDMLNVKETKAYEELVESGMKNTEAEAFIRSLPPAGKKKELRQALKNSDLTAAQKKAVGVALGDKAVNYSSDATFEYSLKTDEQKAYIDKITGAGATTADALEIYELQGNYSSKVEKALALMQEDSYTKAICEALGISESSQEKAKVLYDKNISIEKYDITKQYADADNNGSVSGKEAKAYLDQQTGMSRSEKFTLYKVLTGAKDKNNPYK